MDKEINADKIRMDILIKQMEEMANAPKEEMGKRTPGEKGTFERYAEKYGLETKICDKIEKNGNTPDHGS